LQLNELNFFNKKRHQETDRGIQQTWKIMLLF